MRYDVLRRSFGAILCAFAWGCAPAPEKSASKDGQEVASEAAPDPAAADNSTSTALVPAGPAAPVRAQADAAMDVAPNLSVSNGSVFAAGGGDSMMVATIGAISRLRDFEAIKLLAQDAFRSADVDQDGFLTAEEFVAALDYVDNRDSVMGALGAGAPINGARISAFDAARRRSAALPLDQFAAFLDLKRVEADRDSDGKLDDAEYARFRALINGADGRE